MASYISQPNLYQVQYPTTSNDFLIESPGIFSLSSPWIIIIGVILAVVVLVLIVLFVYFLIRPVDIKFYPPVDIVVNDKVNDTTGASSNGVFDENNGISFSGPTSCSAGPTRQWVTNNNNSGGSCQCLPPFYGPSCQRESYSCQYTAVGTVNTDILDANIGSAQTVDRLSFPFTTNPGVVPLYEDPIEGDTLCTNLCDQTDGCVGVIWNQAPGPGFGINQPPQPTCQLITGDIVIKPGSNIPYSLTEDANFYIKNDVLLQFKDRVFVYKGQRPIRYWLADQYRSFFGDSQSQTMEQKQLIKFNWSPEMVINLTGCPDNGVCQYGDPWYGFFSNRLFSVSNNQLFQTLVSMSQDGGIITLDNQEYVVISPTETDLNLPTHWQEIWGTFTPISTNNTVSANNTDITDNMIRNNINPSGNSLNQRWRDQVATNWFTQDEYDETPMSNYIDDIISN